MLLAKMYEVEGLFNDMVDNTRQYIIKNEIAIEDFLKSDGIATLITMRDAAKYLSLKNYSNKDIIVYLPKVTKETIGMQGYVNEYISERNL